MSISPKISWQNRPALHRRAVYFCTDDRYAPYTLFLAEQIALAHPARDFDLCIVSASAITPHPLYDTLGVRLCQLDVGTIDQAAGNVSRIGFATYLRLFLPQLWAEDYDRLLYLDGDILYQRGDVAALLGVDLHGAPLGAVLDVRQWNTPTHHPRDIAKLNLPQTPYFNAGVLLIDVGQFNAQRIGARVLDVIVARGKDLLWHDQTALNAVIAGNWAQLPLQWNFQYFPKTMLLSAYFDVCFFHFISGRKPFYARFSGYPRRFTSRYRAFLDQYFPPLAAQVHDGTGGPTRWRGHLLVFVLNIIMLRGALRLEQQSNGDFDVLPPSAPPSK